MSEVTQLADLEGVDLTNVSAISKRREAIATKATEIRHEMAAIDDEAGERSLEPGPQQRWNNLKRASERLRTADEVLKEKLNAAAMKLIGTKSELIAPGSFGKPLFPEYNVARAVDPFDGNLGQPLAARARQIAEQTPYADDDRKHATVSMLEAPREAWERDGLATHIIRAGHPIYFKAFAKFARNPEGYRSDLDADERRIFDDVNGWFRSTDRGRTSFGESRAAMSLTGANGGVLVPQELDPQIHLTNPGALNQVRQIATVRQTTSDVLDLVASAGSDAAWLAEGVEVSDNSPTFTAPQITAHKGASWIYGSFEMIADSGFNEAAMLLADAKNRLESSAFTSGTGVGQPYGLITRLSGAGPVITGVSGATGSADLTASDVYRLNDNLAPRWRPNAKWMASTPIYNQVRQLATSANENSWWTDFGQDIPSSLIGYPVFKDEGMDATVVSGTNDYVMLHGDFSQYWITDRVGATVSYVPMVFGANQRPTFQQGWALHFRVGADVVTSNAWKLLHL